MIGNQMTKEREALKLALEALEFANVNHWWGSSNIEQAITAIKKALAQPEQEEALDLFEYWNAVEGWVKIDEVRKHFGSVGCGTIYKTAGDDRVPLYTAPKQRPWVGLTDEEINDAYRCAAEAINFCTPSHTLIVRAAEAKLKEKNT